MARFTVIRSRMVCNWEVADFEVEADDLAAATALAKETDDSDLNFVIQETDITGRLDTFEEIKETVQ